MPESGPAISGPPACPRSGLAGAPGPPCDSAAIPCSIIFIAREKNVFPACAEPTICSRTFMTASPCAFSAPCGPPPPAVGGFLPASISPTPANGPPPPIEAFTPSGRGGGESSCGPGIENSRFQHKERPLGRSFYCSPPELVPVLRFGLIPSAALDNGA